MISVSTPASIVVDPGIVDKVLKGFLNLQEKTEKERERERDPETWEARMHLFARLIVLP